MDIGEVNDRLHTGLRLDYTFQLWAPTSAPGAISVVAEVLFLLAELLI